MGVFDWGSPPIHSAQVEQTNVSTITLIAEIDSTVLGTAHFKDGQSKLADVAWIVGGSSNAQFLLEHALSTGLGSTGVRKVTGVYTIHSQSQKDDRLRVRCASTLTAAFASIQAEYLT
jgi:hypothetical protein